MGDEQAVNVPPLREHSKVAPASLELKVNVAEFDATLPFGPLLMVVSGTTVSIVHVRKAGVASTFKAASLART